MRLIVIDHYDNATHHIDGNEEDIRSQLLTLYPYLLIRFGPYADLNLLVRELDKAQFATAVLLPDEFTKAEKDASGQGLHVIRHDFDTLHGQVHTSDDVLEACRQAAEFLAGHSCTDEQLRKAFLETDDPELAAIIAHGLPASSLEDLRAVLASTLKKSENEPISEPIKFQDVSPTNPSSKDFAKIVQEANDNGEIQPLQVTGKHAKGMLQARNVKTHESYILKPGSGKQNPIIGENESGSTQSQREAAFYALACAFGLGADLPECRLLVIDGKEYAVMKMLPYSYKNMNDLKKEDPNLPARLLHLYNDGTLHKWAALDFIGGNTDRHSGNVMASGDKIKLIDHGSCFAGISFSPATDGRSFVPYYLRPSVKGFSQLPVTEKLRKMPRLNEEKNKTLSKWLLDLKGDILAELLTPYGIDPMPVQVRLEKLQKGLGYQSPDLDVLSAWVVG